jgi:4-amino-4-deoxy-L-arabinose transferase-like glycosyltransferase
MAREAKRVLLPDGITQRRVLLGILLLAFGIRTIGLTEFMPIIGDESIYMHWAEIVENQGEWFISLLDAKPPLQTWLLAIVRILVGGDPLLQARLITVGFALLGTIGIFAVGKSLSGDTAGLVAAGLYSIFPIAVFHERLAYTDGLVNFFGIAIAAASLWLFARSKSGWRRLLIVGVVLGLGLFTKQSVLLFAHLPLLIALWRGWKSPWRPLASCALIYGIAALFFAITWVAIPEGPDTDWRNPALHRSDYYVSKAQLINDPFQKVPANWYRLKRSGLAFLTWPILICASASFPYLLWRMPFAALALASISAVPLLAQCMLLQGVGYPIRWAFPQFWPLLALVALAATDVWRRYIEPLPSVPVKWAVAVAAGLALAGPMGVRASEMLRDPLPFLRAGT